MTLLIIEEAVNNTDDSGNDDDNNNNNNENNSYNTDSFVIMVLMRMIRSDTAKLYEYLIKIAFFFPDQKH